MNLKYGPRQRDKVGERERARKRLSKSAPKLKSTSVRRPDKIIAVSKCVHAYHFNFVSNNYFLEYFRTITIVTRIRRRRKNIQMRSTEARVQMTARSDKRVYNNCLQLIYLRFTVCHSIPLLANGMFSRCCWFYFLSAIIFTSYPVCAISVCHAIGILFHFNRNQAFFFLVER